MGKDIIVKREKIKEITNGRNWIKISSTCDCTCADSAVRASRHSRRTSVTV